MLYRNRPHSPTMNKIASLPKFLASDSKAMKSRFHCLRRCVPAPRRDDGSGISCRSGRRRNGWIFSKANCSFSIAASMKARSCAFRCQLQQLDERRKAIIKDAQQVVLDFRGDIPNGYLAMSLGGYKIGVYRQINGWPFWRSIQPTSDIAVDVARTIAKDAKLVSTDSAIIAVGKLTDLVSGGDPSRRGRRYLASRRTIAFSGWGKKYTALKPQKSNSPSVAWPIFPLFLILSATSKRRISSAPTRALYCASFKLFLAISSAINGSGFRVTNPTRCSTAS